MSASVMTVRGPIDPADMGFTLPHEHIFFDTLAWLCTPADDRKRAIGERPVSASVLEDLRRDPVISRDNLVFSDRQIALEELRLFKEAGGGTIIDVTPPEMERDPSALLDVSEKTGVHVVMGTGHYLQSVHKPEVAQMTVDELYAEMVGDITGGVGDTGVRAGIIGEIGLSGSIHSDERKVLVAAARAQVETGLALSIHPPVPYEKSGMEVLDIVEAEGSDLERVIVCHCYHSISDLDYHRRMADRGAVLEYDRFGCEFYWESWPGGPFEDPEAPGGYREPRDYEVVDAIVRLIDDGYADRILISHDIAYKIQLNHFGGHGFAHIANHVLRYLRDRGVSEDIVEQITVRTPQRLLAVG